MKQKLNPNIYIKAANKILTGESHCCCWALANVICPKAAFLHNAQDNLIYKKYFEPFEKLFKPNSEAYWWSFRNGSFNPPEERAAALLLMAEIAKDENK